MMNPPIIPKYDFLGDSYRHIDPAQLPVEAEKKSQDKQNQAGVSYSELPPDSATARLIRFLYGGEDKIPPGVMVRQAKRSDIIRSDRDIPPSDLDSLSNPGMFERVFLYLFHRRDTIR